MNVRSLQRTARWTALLSFLVGTAIFCRHYFRGGSESAGLLFLFLAVPFNVVLLLILLHGAAVQPKGWLSLLGHGALLLVNIPVAWLYLHVYDQLSSVLRLTLINETGAAISDIRLEGCKAWRLDSLAPEAKQEIWIHITNDCSIWICYRKSGATVREPVSGYETGHQGRPARYRIGKPNEGKLWW